MIKTARLLAVLALTSSAYAVDKDRSKSASMPNGMTVVVSEGALEPRGAGSYSLQLYARNDPAYPYDRFVAGLVHRRNGTVEEIRLVDLNRDRQMEVVVVTRYSGSGEYVSADAFRVQDKSVRLLTSIAGMDARKDVVKALKNKLNSRP
jgi:hypothetical protein